MSENIETINAEAWSETILKLATEAEAISAQWNGDEAGALEDIAQHANEIYEKSVELSNLIKEQL